MHNLLILKPRTHPIFRSLPEMRPSAVLVLQVSPCSSRATSTRKSTSGQTALAFGFGVCFGGPSSVVSCVFYRTEAGRAHFANQLNSIRYCVQEVRAAITIERCTLKARVGGLLTCVCCLVFADVQLRCKIEASIHRPLSSLPCPLSPLSLAHLVVAWLRTLGAGPLLLSHVIKL